MNEWTCLQKKMPCKHFEIVLEAFFLLFNCGNIQHIISSDIAFSHTQRRFWLRMKKTDKKVFGPTRAIYRLHNHRVPYHQNAFSGIYTVVDFQLLKVHTLRAYGLAFASEVTSILVFGHKTKLHTWFAIAFPHALMVEHTKEYIHSIYICVCVCNFSTKIANAYGRLDHPYSIQLVNSSFRIGIILNTHECGAPAPIIKSWIIWIREL